MKQLFIIHAKQKGKYHEKGFSLWQILVVVPSMFLQIKQKPSEANVNCQRVFISNNSSLLKLQYLNEVQNLRFTLLFSNDGTNKLILMDQTCNISYSACYNRVRLAYFCGNISPNKFSTIIIIPSIFALLYASTNN